jgi:hypothetical protein
MFARDHPIKNSDQPGPTLFDYTPNFLGRFQLLGIGCARNLDLPSCFSFPGESELPSS